VTIVDEHNQPIIRAFNRRRNEEKSAYVLRGILQGITGGDDLNKSEILYMDAWLKKQEYLNLEGDALDLVEWVKTILADGKVTKEEADDLRSMIETILEYGVPESPYQEPRVNEFLGLLKGICADDRLDLSEIESIEKWIDRNADMADKFPVEPVYDRIRAAKADRHIDQEEKTDLYKLLSELAGDNSSLDADTSGSVASIFCDIVDEFAHTDKTYCFTGKFLYGTRKRCEQTARELGAEATSRVTRQVDILVIGTLTSRDWRFDNYGRKIESALELRKEHGSPMILSEEQWVSAIKIQEN